MNIPRTPTASRSPSRSPAAAEGARLRRVLLFGRILLASVSGFSTLCHAGDRGTSVTPVEAIPLFNGRDLSTFEVWVPATGGHSDPDHVFTVVDNIDGAAAIRSSGQHFGGLLTRDSYRDYRLVVEYRWGLVTWKPRSDRARDNGILLHCQGEPGNAGKNFDSPWMRSVEFQIIEGGTGDIILVGGFDRESGKLIPARLTLTVQPGQKYWDPAGVPTEFTKGRINWQHRDPAWTDTLGVRGPRDVEKPTGEWNRLEAVCRGGDVTYFVNGTKVIEGRNGSLTHGRILLQSEGAEIFFRRVELQPLHP